MILLQQMKDDGTFLKTNQGREKGKDSDEGQKKKICGGKCGIFSCTQVDFWRQPF